MADHSNRLGGSDTTATAIRSIMLYVMTSPQVYVTLQSEIDKAIRDGKISSPIVRDVKARTLPYLQAVILEGLRMHLPAAGLLSKVVPPEGDTVDGLFVPGGTEIAANTWSVMRKSDTFGQVPDIFCPERWFGISEEKHAEMSRVVGLIFGHGKYKCLGKTVAWLELNKVFVEVSDSCA
jgi:cytochrome P450